MNRVYRMIHTDVNPDGSASFQLLSNELGEDLYIIVTVAADSGTVQEIIGRGGMDGPVGLLEYREYRSRRRLKDVVAGMRFFRFSEPELSL